MVEIQAPKAAPAQTVPSPYCPPSAARLAAERSFTRYSLCRECLLLIQMWPSSREVRRSSIACPPGCSLPASTDEDGAPRKGHPPPHNLRLLSHFMFPLDCPAASGCGRDYAPTSSRARLCFCAERGSAILLQVRAKQIKKKVAMRRDAKSLRPPFGMKNGDGQGALAGGSGSSSSGGGGIARGIRSFWRRWCFFVRFYYW